MGIKKRFLAALFCLLLALALSGCGSEQGAGSSSGQVFAKVQDDLGREVIFEKKPERIVVTSASFLEPLEAVGGADLVVGRPDSKTKMPAYAKDITSVGKVYQIDTEKVLACQPDLVIINKGMNEKLAAVTAPAWLVVNAEALSAKVDRFPAREEIDVPVVEQSIVELYSK